MVGPRPRARAAPREIARCSRSAWPPSYPGFAGGPSASYLAWLDFRPLGLGDLPAATLLERGRLALTPGLNYGREGAGFARLNFGTSPAFVAEAVRRIRRALP